MNAIKVQLIVFLSAGSLLAEPANTVAKALGHQKLSDSEKNELVTLVFKNHETLQLILREQLPDDLENEGKVMAQEFDAIPTEDEGRNRLGAPLGWFLQFVDEELTSYPLVTRVPKDSPAARSQLKGGDVILSAQGVVLYGPSSRNRLINLLKIWPADVPMAVLIARDSRTTNLAERVLRNKEVELELILGRKPQ